MSAKFQLSRVGKLILADFRISLSTYLIYVGILLGIQLVNCYGNAAVNIFDSTDILGGSIIAIFVTFGIFPDLFHPTRGYRWSTLPASNEEKYLSVWTQTALILPAISAVLQPLVASLNPIIDQIMGIQNSYTSPFLWSAYWSYLKFTFVGFWILQAPILFCILHFRTRKVQKTIWYSILIGLGFSILLLVGSSIYLHSQIEINALQSVSFTWIENTYFLNETLWFSLWILGFWLLGWVRMRRQQC